MSKGSKVHPTYKARYRVVNGPTYDRARLVLHAIVQPPATLDGLDSLSRSAANRKPRAPPQVA